MPESECAGFVEVPCAECEPFAVVVMRMDSSIAIRQSNAFFRRALARD
jgi:phage FluMu protein Com